MLSDKQVEKKRYDGSASVSLSNGSLSKVLIGSKVMPAFLRSPYQYYEEMIKTLVTLESRVLEIGAGSGLHTLCIAQTGASVIATDISSCSLDLLQSRMAKAGVRVDTKISDMEFLSFDNEGFDIVTSAGSLSYGDNKKVMLEIYRVLKKGGLFICVDSLNHNPIYRFNRLIHYFRGSRTLSTLKRMPTISMIESYEEKFGFTEVSYFGALSWLAPLLNRMLSDEKVTAISDAFDEVFSVKKSAFKFVMVARKDKE